MKYLLERPRTSPGGCDGEEKEYRVIALPESVSPPSGAKQVADTAKETDGWVDKKPAEPLKKENE